MIQKINSVLTSLNRRMVSPSKGQTSLILILLTAAALIILAITLNWGRIAQTKVQLSIAADQAASLLVSETSSYGLMEKESNLQGVNQISSVSGIIISIIMVIVIIIIAIFTWGAGAGLAPALIALGHGLTVIGVAAAVVNLALQVAVVAPGEQAMWNKLQKDQPIQQQFYEAGISTALGDVVGDQVKITDYFDSNSNGSYGYTGVGLPSDTLGRFAFFYTDRLKMLNQPPNSRVVFFYNQLKEFINGETCGQNAVDNNLYPSIPLNPACQAAGVDCIAAPTDPVCQMKVPGGFQLNDGCTDSNPGLPGYNPYCDPCCQPLSLPNPAYDPNANPPNPLQPKYKNFRPTTCPLPADCKATDPGYPNDDPNCVPAQCIMSPNNPYGSIYPYVYDSTYQEYSNGVSFLDQFGRDQQMTPTLPLNGITGQGNFPNGIYPFFWLLKDYSPEVDNIDPTTIDPTVPGAQGMLHWCAAGTVGSGSTFPSYTAPTGFTDLAQLGQAPFTLPYTCQGKDCCVNYLPDGTTTASTLTSASLPITIGNAPTASITIRDGSGVQRSVFQTGTSINVTVTATPSPAGGSIVKIEGHVLATDNSGNVQDKLVGTSASSPYNYPSTTASNGSYQVYAIATDSNGVSVTASQTISVIDGPTVSITSPGSGNTYTTNDTIAISATASESNGGTIASVAFYNNGVILSSVLTSAPYAYQYVNPPVGNYSITAVATDANGLTKTSRPVTGTVTAATSTDTSTGTGTAVAAASSMNSPMIVNTLNAAQTPAVTGNAGAVPQANASCLNSALPSSNVAVTATIGGVSASTFPVGSTITLTANVSGINGKIKKVQFFNGTSLLGTSTSLSSPYTFDWTPAQGSFCVNAVVIQDNSSPSPNSNGTVNGPIDVVGNASYGISPVNAPVFGEGASGKWQEGDNQFCSASWPYNGNMGNIHDGSCEWTNSPSVPTSTADVTTDPSKSTFDNLDDAMHALSDFLNFSNKLLGKEVGVLSSSFVSWYPQAAQWIAPKCTDSAVCSSAGGRNGGATTSQECQNDPCNGGADGRLLSLYDPIGYPNVADSLMTNNTTQVDKLNDWNTAIKAYLNNDYSNASAWCLPPANDTSMNIGGSPTAERQYITSAGAANDADIMANDPSYIPKWGDLGHVVACLNYNASKNSDGTQANYGSVYNYQQCQSALTSGACPASLPSVCSAENLGRSLSVAKQAPAYDGCAGGFAQWVNSSLTLAQDASPKFAKRAQFLNDIFTRARSMVNIFTQGDIALHSFLKPCGNPTCTDGGPAAQLMYARLHNTNQVSALPNSVIYGWVDKAKANGQTPGYAHIVKVTAYSPGRQGNAPFVQSLLPWVQADIGIIMCYYTLVQRDGYVYVSVKRWDADHNNILTFPNNHVMWQASLHNPSVSGPSDATGIPAYCAGLNPDNKLSSPIGFGLLTNTVKGLAQMNILPQDQKLLAQAYMLNDEGDGVVDKNAGGNGSACDSASASGTSYCKCLSESNKLLRQGVESHACAQYIAASNASQQSSGNGDHGYTLKFVDCNSIDGGNPPEDLTYVDNS